MDTDIQAIDRVLRKHTQQCNATVEASYGTSIDARDRRWHDIRHDATEAQEASAALDRIKARLAGLTPVEVERFDPNDCTCHLMRGETCQACNERYAAE